MSDLFGFSYINELALAGAAATLIITLIAVAIYFKNIAGGKSDGELGEGDWDGIKEYKNPLPLGWAISFLVLGVWAIWYMCAPAGLPFAYPLNAYSQIGDYNEEVAEHNAKFEAKWQNVDEATLRNMGESIFSVQCAPCHGLTGDGIGGKVAADLTKWGTEGSIVDSVLHGSKGLGYDLIEMSPNLDGLIENEGEIELAKNYLVKYLAQTKPLTAADENTKEAEAEVWNNVCAACHGEDGKGNGAPDLTNYGKPEFVVDVLNRGKNGYIGSMPSFNDSRLTDIQKRAVGAYVLSLRR
ncbi:MAG: c-type cytochrome [Campylobacteraceae bacterium]|jgi:cytochrome c oxidase cbb3-type subunit 3|nr:c-type cytochrome [Campylobacteraceae bacterium]